MSAYERVKEFLENNPNSKVYLIKSHIGGSYNDEAKVLYLTSDEFTEDELYDIGRELAKDSMDSYGLLEDYDEDEHGDYEEWEEQEITSWCSWESEVLTLDNIDEYLDEDYDDIDSIYED